MNFILWTILGAIVTAIVLLGMLAFAVRRAVGSPDPLTLRVTIQDAPFPHIQLRVNLRPGQRRIVVEGISISRHAVELLGVSPPQGFTEQPYVTPERSSFEADLDALGDHTPSPTVEQIADEEEAQYAEHRKLIEELNRESVQLIGQLTVTEGQECLLRFPVSSLGPAGGQILVHFRGRIGLWSYASGQTVEFST